MNKFEINVEADGGKSSTLAAAEKLVGTFNSTTPAAVALQSPGSGLAQSALWSGIRTRARWMAYPIFEQVVANVFGCPDAKTTPLVDAIKAGLPKQDCSHPPSGCYHGSEAYDQLKAIAEAFLALLCSPENLLPDNRTTLQSAPTAAQAAEVGFEASRNPEIDWAKLQGYLSPTSYPYLKNIKLQTGLAELAGNKILCDGLRTCFCPLELIWSYWHEEGMLAQSLNSICLRFQNKRGPNPHDPLANLRLNPLRPLSTVLWGYIQDEHNRLTVARRAYEYDHEYGLRLMGKAVTDIQTVDSRSKFLEAFHNLLYVARCFYKEADDTTFKADAFPVLNALKELHLILAQGANNQFGDLPWAARVEMLIQEWLLARPEIREFLGGAPMVPYKEGWMANADAMKTMQGWTDVSVSQFRDLGVFGEQILLSVRYEEWINLDDPAQAYNWAVYWRPEIQNYIHSYRAVTGVDLSSEITDSRSAAARNVQPAIHQMRRMATNGAQRNGVAGRRLTNV